MELVDYARAEPIVTQIRKLETKIHTLSSAREHVGSVWWNGLQLSPATQAVMLDTMDAERRRLLDELSTI